MVNWCFQYLHGTVERNAFFTVTTGNIDIDIKTGNKKEHVAGNVAFRADGKMQETIQGSHGVEASNYSLSDSGSLELNQEIIAGTVIYAGQDVRTPSHSLNDHQHSYEKPQHSAGMTPTMKLGGGGGSSNASGPSAAKPDPAVPVVPATHIDTLVSFNGETSITLAGNGAQKITNYWERNQTEMESIVERLMTYEPCDAHLNKGAKT